MDLPIRGSDLQHTATPQASLVPVDHTGFRRRERAFENPGVRSDADLVWNRQTGRSGLRNRVRDRNDLELILEE